MLTGLIYLLLFFGLTWYNGMGGLFFDRQVSRKTLAILLLLKAAAIPVFYLVHEAKFGGLEKSDSGKFLNDVNAVVDLAMQDPSSYLKLLFGFQGESDGSTAYKECLSKMLNWDQGVDRDYLYHDNRILIRIHSVFGFIAFGSWFAHAVFSCLMSLLGIFYCYKAFKEFFAGKEVAFLVILCLFPSLWYHTGAFLKEGPMLLAMGATLRVIKRLSEGKRNFANFFILAFMIFISVLLKPYVLFSSLLCFSMFFVIHYSKTVHRKLPAYCIIMLVAGTVAALTVGHVKGKSIAELASSHRAVFSEMANGGIFLSGQTRFVKLDFDTSQIRKVGRSGNTYTIKKGVAFTYWEDTHHGDAMTGTNNQDTLSQYQLVDMAPPSSTNIDASGRREDIVSTIGYALADGIFRPLIPYNTNRKRLVMVFENLLIVISLLIVIPLMITGKKDRLLPAAFLFFSMVLCIIIGMSISNSGAIFRYRGPAVVFIPLAALYYAEYAFILKRFFKKN